MDLPELEASVQGESLDAWYALKARLSSGLRSDPPDSEDETIPDRVARIKIRVAELVSSVEDPAASHSHGQEDPMGSAQLPKLATTTAATAATISSEDQDILTRVGRLPTDPKLNFILSKLAKKDLPLIFSAHGISDLWLPIHKQTIRRLLNNNEGEKYFLQLQNNMLDANIHILDNNASESDNVRSHAALEDDEHIVTEHRMLGEGGFSVVEEVSIRRHRKLMRCVRKRVSRPKVLKAQKQIMAAFAREIGVMRKVNHQHCVRFLGSYTDFDHVNILSSPVADMDLATFLDNPIGIREEAILYRGMGCLCNVINYLHQNDIRHEDLKPQNVLIHGDNILLTDFGFSLDFSNDSMSTTTGRPSAWTIRYSAPEVLECEPRNRATDIYSLGCVLLEMISGFYGISLSDVKAHWKNTGNGQSSFARNPEATEVWFQDHLKPADHRQLSWRVRHLSYLVRLILREHRLYRPTAQQIVDRLLDLSLLLPNSSQYYHTPCRKPTMCIGLAHKRDMRRTLMPMSPSADEKKAVHTASFSYPWDFDGWTYELCDFDWSLIYKDEYSSEDVTHRHDPHIRAAAQRLYYGACRTGSTAEFWSSHHGQPNELQSEDAKEQAKISAYTLSIKHIVYTRLVVKARVEDSLAKDGPYKWREVQVTLLPICRPRSRYHGCFFWMLSWCGYHNYYTNEDGLTDMTVSDWGT
jgi:serine/threonine protein kinase